MASRVFYDTLFKMLACFWDEIRDMFAVVIVFLMTPPMTL